MHALYYIYQWRCDLSNNPYNLSVLLQRIKLFVRDEVTEHDRERRQKFGEIPLSIAEHNTSQRTNQDWSLGLEN